MPSPRRVLLADPLYHVHSILHYRASLGSAGFEQTEFTVLTSVFSDEEERRLETFRQSQPRLTVRLRERHEVIASRTQCWRHYLQAMRQVEGMLAQQEFDLVIYIMADHVLPIFALPMARPFFPHHFSVGVRGLVFRHNGLRQTATSVRGRLLEFFDRWVLGRALRSGAFRRVAFLDREAARRARALEKTPLCIEGIDPVDIPDSDRSRARTRFALSPEDFVFLLFGSFDDRKGFIETLEVIRDTALPHERIVVLIAGLGDAEFIARLEAVIATCRYRVVLHNQFIPDADLPDYFAAADCVVCAYKNFVASSGVLLHGASAGNLAIVSSGGVMADDVREFGFGEVVSVEDRAGFGASVQRLMNLTLAERSRMSEGALAYARSRDSRFYMTQFLTAEEHASVERSS
ncbi:MAG TPA: glycosyltransferase [Chthoniobacter sp.]|nr:glycosyltransferase [Chthoniobacter sp.]